MKNNFTKILMLSILFSFFAWLASASPTQTPTGGISAPITQLNTSQVKNGALGVNSLVVGSGTGFSFLKSNGFLGINMEPISSSNIYPKDPTAELDVNGEIKLSELTSSGASVCADPDGQIVQCGSTVFVHSGDNQQPYETKTYTIPNGVYKIQVELWGAGGAGWPSYDDADRSPDNYSNCNYDNGSQSYPRYIYKCGSGGSSMFLESNGSQWIGIMVADGGTGAVGTSPGTGGSTAYSSSKIISTSVDQKSGESGSIGGSVSNYSLGSNLNCGSNSYSIALVEDGGTGGYGGRSGYGSRTPVANGGKSGQNLLQIDINDACIGGAPLFNGLGYLPEYGMNGFYGAGGSGLGGVGGKSDQDITLLNTHFSGDNGHPGGGGGGYIKADLNVSPGQVYKIKLSHRGVVNTNAWWLTKDCADCTHWTPSSGGHGGVDAYGIENYSLKDVGNGSPAYAKITIK